MDDNFGVGYALGASEGNNNNGGGGGFGWGGDAWVLIILFALIFGWGNGGWGGGMGGGSGTQGALTRTDLSSEFAFNDLQNAVRGISNSVNTGFQTLDTRVCQQSYETAQMINGVTAAVNGGFSALNTAICQNAYENAGLINGLSNTIQGGFNAANIVALQGQNALSAQLAECCCANREAIAGINYNMATQACDTRNLIQSTTRDMIDTNNANTRAILEKLTQQEMEAKNAQIAALNQQLFTAQLAASQSAQTQQIVSTLNPTPVPCYPAASPCGIGNWSPAVLANGGFGFNNGCSGCGC